MTHLEMKERTRPLEKPVDISELGKDEAGNVISANRRLFVQLLAFGGLIGSAAPLVQALQAAGVQGALYADLNDPHGVGLITYSEDPGYFVEVVRPVLNQFPFDELTPKLEYSLLGRTYTIGYEKNLEETLITRPISRIIDPALCWVIWYPLRRKGEFELLPPEEQNIILQEHGGIGRAYGMSGHGHDVRLACHGLDTNDNDFIAGLMGKELAPLSKIVQRMRKTKQTSTYLEKLGPFFVGKVLWQSKE